jgi:hypothetical protein
VAVQAVTSNDAEIHAGAAELRRWLELVPGGESPVHVYTSEGLDVWCTRVTRSVLEAMADVDAPAPVKRGRWCVLEECPACRDRLVGAAVSSVEGLVRCGACGCVSAVLTETNERLRR